MKIRTLLFGALTIAAASYAGAATHTVKSGDNLYRIALNYGVTLHQLQQANPGVHAQSLRVGQKLTIPSRSGTTAPAAVAKNTTPSSRPTVAGTYEVKPGDNLSKIARVQGVSLAALQAANPNLNPNKMAIGQKIHLPGSSSVSRTPVAEIARTAPPAPAPVQEQPVLKPTPEPAPEPEVANTTPAPAPEKESTPSPAPTLTDSSAQPVKNQTKEVEAPAAYRLIKTTRELTLAEVAKEYHTTPEKINSLNGWSFSPQTLLAVDSELYIPAQP